MRLLAYIALDDEGYVTLYEGDGTEAHKTVIARGRSLTEPYQIAQEMDDLRLWAESEGYEVIVPAYDLSSSPLPPDESETIAYEDMEVLMDDLFDAGNFTDEEGPQRDLDDELS